MNTMGGKFTEGPFLKGMTNTSIEDRNGNLVASVYADYKTKEEVLANRALFVAAPEMYQMLNACLSVIKKDHPESDYHTIEKVLAKARGE